MYITFDILVVLFRSLWGLAKEEEKGQKRDRQGARIFIIIIVFYKGAN